MFITLFSFIVRVFFSVGRHIGDATNASGTLGSIHFYKTWGELCQGQLLDGN